MCFHGFNSTFSMVVTTLKCNHYVVCISLHLISASFKKYPYLGMVVRYLYRDITLPPNYFAAIVDNDKCIMHAHICFYVCLFIILVSFILHDFLYYECMNGSHTNFINLEVHWLMNQTDIPVFTSIACNENNRMLGCRNVFHLECVN